MDQMKTGWFSEVNDFWAGQCMSLKVDEVLHSEKSEYQDILVLKTTNHGRVLILDGIIQCTERDEFVYQEMITFLPLCAHPHPKKVLIVGGGDGGVAREVVKHPQVETVVQVEIDAKVVEISKKYLPFMSSGFSSPKLTLIIGDGFRYMREHSDEFDVIITDSSDPIGPAVNLFTESYFELLRKALRGDGVICSQAGNVWYDLRHIQSTMRHCRKHFDEVRFASVNVPTYPTGCIGFVVGSRGVGGDCRVAKRKFTENEREEMKLRFYNEEVHRSAFVLPNFVDKEIGKL